MSRYPLWAWALLLSPARIEERLERIRESGLLPRTPNSWQIAQGVLRMLHRLIFRSQTVGTSTAKVRDSWRARALWWRPLRLPFLLAERAVAPLDLSGLLSQQQFLYDLQMLSLDPGALDELVQRARAVVTGADPRAGWLRDLTVFEGYHESLLAAAERAQKGELSPAGPDAADPDISFVAYLDWCSRQPATPRGSLEALLS
jgi:hypothetical protein